jgi:hypothetical protein
MNICPSGLDPARSRVLLTELYSISYHMFKVDIGGGYEYTLPIWILATCGSVFTLEIFYTYMMSQVYEINTNRQAS